MIDFSDPLIRAALAGADRFYAAFLQGDLDAVSRLTSDRYLQTDVNGHVQDKEAWLREYYQVVAEAIHAGEGWHVFERVVDGARSLGDAVVLVGTMRLRRGSTPLRTLRFTQVWIQEESEWRCALAHNAWIHSTDS